MNFTDKIFRENMIHLVPRHIVTILWFSSPDKNQIITKVDNWQLFKVTSQNCLSELRQRFYY